MTSLQIVGYSDPLSVTPGETARFMVSSRAPTYEARILRLLGADGNGGLRVGEVETPVRGRFPGREQALAPGSYAAVPDHPLLRGPGFVVEAWIWPTSPGSGTQALLGKWCEAEMTGYALVLDELEAAAVWVGDGTGSVVRASTAVPMRAFTWYFVSARQSMEESTLIVEQRPLKRWPGDASAVRVETRSDLGAGSSDSPLTLAGHLHSDGRPTNLFNGKIARPRLLRSDGTEIARWDLSQATSSARVVDAGHHRLHGTVVNLPTRAVTGPMWTGAEVDWRRSPAEYDAILFHDDDLEDAAWECDFAWKLPADTPSGIYAAHLRAGDDEDYVPFFVRPSQGKPQARIAFLVPTFSYLAYANEHVSWQHPSLEVPPEVTDRVQKEDLYTIDHRLRSLYDHHDDGLGCCLASRRRPLVNMRPLYKNPLIDSPHQLGADLFLTGWLDLQRQPFDVITDEDLHGEGVTLLEQYRVVLTGSHPEYWSRPMLEALDAYLARGGRLMYPGGNGFYWVTSVDSEHPHVIEVRRGQRGTGTWRSQPGECHHQTTGEPGGLWRDRGRPPQALVGVGMTAQGFDRSLPYVRTPVDLHSRAGFVFEGIEPDAPIGDSGAVLGGAAGLEVDRMDFALGTPPDTQLLAQASGFSDSYQHVVEEVTTSDSRQGGSVNPLVRADMVLFETPEGGAVFSVGSIAWCGSLLSQDGAGAPSRIMANVLGRFLSDRVLGETP